MEVFTDNRQKDLRTAFDISPNHNGLSGFSPSLILLVDDDPDVRALTRTFLEHEGYSVFSSGDAERAVQIFRNVPQIDLLVTDLYLPGRSGVDLGRDLKAIREDLPVLLISGGVVAEEQMAKMLEEGWSFLAKPFRLTELLATVHRILAPLEARRWREEQQGVSVDSLMRDVIDGTNFP
jgi:DNA-binding response OmpR family regulator